MRVTTAFRHVGLTFLFSYEHSWRVLDVTVAMAYAMLSTYGKANRGISAAAATLRGYHSVNPLLPVERKHLVLLLCCRLACSVTLGAYSYQKNPENKYLLFQAGSAWKSKYLFSGFFSHAGSLFVPEKSRKQVFALPCRACLEIVGNDLVLQREPTSAYPCCI